MPLHFDITLATSGIYKRLPVLGWTVLKLDVSYPDTRERGDAENRLLDCLDVTADLWRDFPQWRNTCYLARRSSL